MSKKKKGKQKFEKPTFAEIRAQVGSVEVAAVKEEPIDHLQRLQRALGGVGNIAEHHDVLMDLNGTLPTYQPSGGNGTSRRIVTVGFQTIEKSIPAFLHVLRYKSPRAFIKFMEEYQKSLGARMEYLDALVNFTQDAASRLPMQGGLVSYSPGDIRCWAEVYRRYKEAIEMLPGMLERMQAIQNLARQKDNMPKKDYHLARVELEAKDDPTGGLIARLVSCDRNAKSFMKKTRAISGNYTTS